MLDQLGRQQNLAAKVVAGPKPKQNNFTVKSTVDLGTHTRSLVTYLVDDDLDEHVPAWLLTPATDMPPRGWPCILAIHQHAGQFDMGKSEPAGIIGHPDYHYGLELCLRGYVVLCPDLLCFEDRRPPEGTRHAAHRASLDGVQYEQFEFTKRILHGSCLQAKYLHDLHCAVDALVELSSTDSTRIGAIGHSLGGQEVLWMSWYDRRIRASASSCGFSLLESIIQANINHNRAAYVPGLLNLCDLDALLCDIAPRAFFLSAGEADRLFPIDGVKALASTARDAYDRLGKASNFCCSIFPGGHGFPGGIRAQAYEFLDHHLKQNENDGFNSFDVTNHDLQL